MRIVIPARFASTRFPGKPLALIHGKPMIQWTWEAAMKTGADTIVATDDQRIVDAVRQLGGVAVMTGYHSTGMDRVAEVAKDWEDDEIVVNLQGDEPLMDPSLITHVHNLLSWPDSTANSPMKPDTLTDMATISMPLSNGDEVNQDVVKVIVKDRVARSFSRNPLPYNGQMRRHIGLYAYRASLLRRLTALPVGPLEARLNLEQLRALENEIPVRVSNVHGIPSPAVDRPADIQRVEACIAQ